ncbi:MAG: choice-of-anchor Q domain-containing protein [Bacteroidota bacterium]|nr:choice-of-anchor Q domain-containing protein [Bacteroidota bacterium]
MLHVRPLFAACTVLLLTATLQARVLEVGPSHALTLPSQAALLAEDGDTVLIAAGEYRDAARWTADNLLIRGVGGHAHVRDRTWGGKAIWVIQGENTTVEWVEFSGARVQDKNGAGIRQEGRHLTLRYCHFHHNEMGILTGNDAESHILFEYCVFASNGYGDGYSHNMYINHVGRFTMRFCYSHDAVIGHNVKSRAHETWLLYNRFDEAEGGNTSREIDIPNGGLAVVVGNVLDHGPNTDNSNLLGFGHEGYSNPRKTLFVVNNTFVTARGAGGFVTLPSSPADSVYVYNNIFAGRATPVSGETRVLDSAANLALRDIAAAGFRDAAQRDYRLLPSSPAIDAGVPVGSADGMDLRPTWEYRHTADGAARPLQGGVDCGAFEYVPPVGVTGTVPAAARGLHIRTVAPHPVRSTARLSFSHVRPETLLLRVCDATGRSLRPAREIPCRAGMQTVDIDVAGYPPGLYFITLTGRNSAAQYPLLLH